MRTLAELIDYVCATCGHNKWNLQIAHSTDNKTYLLVSCSNSDCIDKKVDELGGTAEPNMIVWDEFDITGQGRDAEDLLLDTEAKEMN